MLIFITKHIANLIITSAYMEKIHLPPIDTTCQPVKKKKKNPTIFSCSIPECDVFPTHLHTIHLTPSTLTHIQSHHPRHNPPQWATVPGMQKERQEDLSGQPSMPGDVPGAPSRGPRGVPSAGAPPWNCGSQTWRWRYRPRGLIRPGESEMGVWPS